MKMYERKTPEALAQYLLARNTLFLYCLATFFLYFFGPIPWVPVAPLSLTVIFFSYIAFFIGSRARGRRARKTYFGKRDQPKGRLFFSAGNPVLQVFFIIVITAVKNIVLFSTPLPSPLTILSSYDLLKNVEEENQIFAYLNFLISPLTIWLLAGLVMNKGKLLSKTNLLISGFAVLFYLYSVTLTGSGNAIMEMMILFGLVFFRRHRVSLSTFLKLILGVVFVALTLAAVLRPRLADLDSITIPVEIQQGELYEFSLSDASLVDFSGFIMTFYVTNGYQGFQYSEGIRPDAMFYPLAASKFMQRQYQRFGLLPADFQSLEDKAEKRVGWPAGLLWSTAFLWFKENVPLLILPVLLYFFGIGFFHVIYGYLVFPSAFRLVQSMLMVKVIMFLPLNAISLATGEELSRTLIFLLFPALISIFVFLNSALGLWSRGR